MEQAFRSTLATGPKSGVHFKQLSSSAQPIVSLLGPADAGLLAPTGPAPRGMAGVTLGERLDAVQARCAWAGWTCTRRTRVVKGLEVERLHVGLPTGEVSRLIVIAKEGVVFGLRAEYRVGRAGRYDKLARAFGAGTTDANGTVWTWPGTRAELSRNQSVFVLAGTDTAASLKAPMPTRMIPMRLITIDRSAIPILPNELFDVPLQLVSQQIPVTLTLDSLKCIEEDDPTSLFSGDSPNLYITGLHTAGIEPWPAEGSLEKSFDDVESGDTKQLNVTVFDSGDARRFVAAGESVGFHASLVEADDTPGGDDEIDFADKIIPFATALAQKGSTQSGTLTFQGDGAKYTVDFHYTVGMPLPVALPKSAFGSASPQPYAGAYTWNVDGVTNVASLQYTAPNAAFPYGQLVGTWTENGQTLSIVPRRLVGTYFEFYLVEPRHGVLPRTRRMVGYLVDNGITKAIAGTSYGATKTGFFMRRTP